MLKFITDNFESIITFVGFFATYFITKYSCKREIEKLRKEKMLEKIEPIPFKLLELMYKIQKNTNNKHILNTYTDNFAEILHTILAYCSIDAIKIASYIQEMSYKNSFKNWELLCSYSILVSQLKFDLTGEHVSPEFYFKMKINDYSEKMAAQVKHDNNKIIKQLNLSEKFLIK